MLIVGKSATQDITLTLYVLAAVQFFREKITGLFLPLDFLNDIPNIFLNLIKRILDQSLS